ncbi:hypothetical protein PUR34_19990 [Streptomyces sp. JV185]|uniref:hypothetical protein n=1 Tax=Streptomyces sp. JV185 TaxID=858638 RepID=UPI002E767744|nr:hypothetical protein [Streptomyces sp. JV185]MEE1770353.1 hypothetical protein [Streptomyces sp. JV185]
MRKPFATAAALSTAVLAAGMLLSAPAANAQASAYPVSNFDVTLGNTYTRGTVTWYNRSVLVSGEHKSVDVNSCRGTTAFLLDSNSNDVGHFSSLYNVCGTSDKFSFTVDTYLAGVNVVRICLDDGAKQYPITYLKCVRYSRP